MANEVTAVARLTVKRSTLSDNGTFPVISSNARYVSGIQTIGVTPEVLSVGELSGSLGYCFIKNTDPSNFITVGDNAANELIKIKAGEIALFRFDDTITAALPPKLTADTAGVDIEYIVSED